MAMADRSNSDFPPFSRVFVVCSKSHNEDVIKEAFQQFGTVEDVWMVKDRMTKENKGICYVKYDKASAAALAIEGLDGKPIGDEAKPIKAGQNYSFFLPYVPPSSHLPPSIPPSFQPFIHPSSLLSSLSPPTYPHCITSSCPPLYIPLISS